MFKRLVVVLNVGIVAVILSTGPGNAADIGYNGFEVRGGVATPQDLDTGLGLGIAVDIGELYDQLRLYPAATYTSTSTETLIFLTPVEFDMDIISVGAEVRYFPNPDLTGWYFGGGPYLHQYESSIAGVDFLEGSSTGLTGVAGWNFANRLGVEARFGTASQDFSVFAVLSFGAS